MNVLLVPAHPGFPGQIPQSRKTVVCVCVVILPLKNRNKFCSIPFLKPLTTYTVDPLMSAPGLACSEYIVFANEP